MSDARGGKVTAREVQLFQPGELQLGDVVLECSPGPGSAITAWVTKGPYSHAMIWVGGDFLEAMPNGVRSLSFARVPVVDANRWGLFRVRPNFASVAAEAARVARNLAFKEYDLPGALRTVCAPRGTPVPSKLFCSQLVVRAFLEAGLDLLPGMVPEAVTPNDLVSSPHLVAHSLPLVPARDLLSEDYPKQWLNRSKAYKSSPMAKELEVSSKLFKSVRADLEKVEIPSPFAFPGNLLEILEVLPHLERKAGDEVADKLLKGMEELGYFRLMTAAIAPIWFGAAGNASSVALGGASPLEGPQRHQLNADACLEADRLMPHPLWKRLRAMYAMNSMVSLALNERLGGR